MDLLRAFWATVFSAIAASSSVAQTSQGVDQEEEDWSRTLQIGTVEAFQQYLDKYPDGTHTDEAFACSVDAFLCSEQQPAPTSAAGVIY